MKGDAMTSIYDFSARTLEGGEVSLSDYRGKVLLIVNTASKCGFTPQYAGLEKLQRQFTDRGFAVLGFPCDQFGHQEPGDATEIRNFCATKYDVTFPLFAKVEVNGANAHPLWAWLKSEKTGFLGGAIKWNFTKFLVDRAGEVVDRSPPTTTPDAIAPKIEALLTARPQG
jgi:glutathione peroxidase